MPELRDYRLFVSHAWEYSQPYLRFVEFLDDASNFHYSNYSVPEHDPVEGSVLEEALRRQIRPVSVVVVLAGMYSAHREWIQFEIDFAAALGKPILGVVPWGQQRTPLTVQAAATEMVGWNTSSIVAAIRRLAP